MIRYENQLFEEGDLPSFIKSAVFQNCRFKGSLPNFLDCELHDCDLSRTEVGEMIDCALFSTTLDGADFSSADVRFSRTNAGSPCSARHCEWQGMAAIFDCGFFQGLKGDEQDAEFFLIMATLPITPLKSKLYRTFSDDLKQQLKQRVGKTFRTRQNP